jgi:hypothetical protein
MEVITSRRNKDARISGGITMPIDTFSRDAKFEFFGRDKYGDRDLCPHCGKHAGNLIDEGSWEWNGRKKASEYEYQCAICKGEWTIRIYSYTGFEKYPGPYGAVIYIPES